jgi:hypothetical protein
VHSGKAKAKINELKKCFQPRYMLEIFLGHKELWNTERCITIARTIFGPGTNEKFIIKVAANSKEAIQLGENGFEPFDVVDGVTLYRKRK